MNKYDVAKNEFINLFIYLDSPQKDSFINMYIKNYKIFSYSQMLPLKYLTPGYVNLKQLVTNIGVWGKDIFSFIYEYCVNNSYDLSSLFERNTITKIISRFESLLIAHKIYNPFAELILKYYRDKNLESDFNLFISKLEKIHAYKNMVSYHKSLLYFTLFNYPKLKEQLVELIDSLEKESNANYIIRIISLYYLLEGEQYLSTETLEKFKPHFEKAECSSSCNSKQYSYFIYLFHRNMTFTFDDKILQNRLYNIKTSVKTVNEYINGFSIKQKLNFLEYSGLPFYFVFSRDNINEYLNEIGTDKFLLLRFFLYCISFFGTSADEKKLCEIVPLFLKQMSKEDIKRLYENVFATIQYKLDSFERGKEEQSNPKVYIYLMNEILLRLDYSYSERFANFLFEKLKKNNLMVVSGIQKAEMWGWKTPVINLLNHIRNKELYKWLLDYFVKEYISDTREIIKHKSPLGGYVSTSSNIYYIYELIKQDDFKTEVSIYFNKKSSKEILNEDLKLKSELCLACYNFISSEYQKRITKYIEENYSETFDPFF